MASTSVTFDILARDRASQTFKNVGDSANRSSSHIAAFGAVMKKAALGVGLLTGAAAVFTFKVGSAYVDSLNKIQALTGATDKQMRGAADQLEKNAGLYAKMGQTTGDAAAGVVELTKSGLSLDEALKSVYGTMTLAKAGEMEVGDAAAVTANALNTFHLEAKKAGAVANYLANAANISSADVSDLAESLKYVAPVAAAAGVSIKQTNAVLAELANAGIKGSAAGTALRTFLLNLQAPAAAGAAAMKKLGVDVFDASGKMKPLGDVIGELQKGLDGLSQKQKASALKDIFGKVGIAGATTILKEGKKGLEEYTKGIDKAGAATKLAESKSRGLAGSFNIVKASAISGAQSIYRQFSPILDKAIRPLAVGFANFASGLGPKLQKGLDKVKGTLSRFDIKGVGKNLAKQAKEWAAPIIDGVKLGLKTGDWSGLGAALGDGLAKAIKGAGAALGKIADAFSDLMAKVDWIGIGIAVGKQAIPFVLGFAAGIANVDLLALLQGVADHWFEILIGVLSIALTPTKFAGPIAKMLAKIPFAGKLLSWAFNAINGLGRPFRGWVARFFKDMGEAFRKGFAEVVKSSPLGQASKMISKFNAPLKHLETWIYSKGIDAMRGLGRGLGRGFVAVVRWVASLPGKVVGPLLKLDGLMLSRGVEAMGKLAKGLVSKIGDVLAPLRALGGKIKGALGNLGTLLYQAGKDLIYGLWNGVKSAAGGFLSYVGSLAGKVKNAFKNPLGIFSPSKVFRKYGQNIMEGLLQGIKDKELTVQAAMDRIAGAIDKVGSKISAAMGRVSNLQGIRSGFKGTFTADSVFGTDLSEGGDVQTLLDAQAHQARVAHRLLHDVKSVTRRGLSESLVRQLQSQGTAGAAALHQLAQGSNADIRRLNRLNNRTNDSLRAAGLRAGDFVRGGSINADIRTAQKQVRTLEHSEHILEQLEHHLKEIAHNQKKDQTIIVEIDGEAIIRSIHRRNNRKGVKSANV